MESIIYLDDEELQKLSELVDFEIENDFDLQLAIRILLENL